MCVCVCVCVCTCICIHTSIHIYMPLHKQTWTSPGSLKGPTKWPSGPSSSGPVFIFVRFFLINRATKPPLSHSRAFFFVSPAMCAAGLEFVRVRWLIDRVRVIDSRPWDKLTRFLLNLSASYDTLNCNTLQHTATHRYTFEAFTSSWLVSCSTCRHSTTLWTATHCNTLQHTAAHLRPLHQVDSFLAQLVGILQHPALQHTATKRYKLQHIDI